jgi:hypothetical protein
MFTQEDLEQLSEIETRLSDGSLVQPPEDPPVPFEMQDGTNLAELMELMKQVQEEDQHTKGEE